MSSSRINDFQAEFLRDRIAASGRSIPELARATGIPDPVLYRFVNRQRRLQLSTAEKVADVLEIDLHLAETLAEDLDLEFIPFSQKEVDVAVWVAAYDTLRNVENLLLANLRSEGASVRQRQAAKIRAMLG